jgi:hypothetical protein
MQNDNDNYDNGSGFDSRETKIIIIDEPGDRTVRPFPPELLPIMQALKEKRDRIIAEFGPPPDSDSPDGTILEFP